MLEKILQKVQKPTRYIGGEFGCVKKNPKDVKIRFALCFPDLYEVGMSHLGMKILYHMKNERNDTYCERAFLPWDDMIEELENNNIPLYALESGDPLKDFDFLGFSLQYEMCYTNVLAMLKLARIPVKACDRDDNFPIICAGGSCTYNPEPMADFIDFFIIGEGEEVNNEVLSAYAAWKDKGGGKKSDFLYKIATTIKGVYVPAFYDVEYDDNKVKSVKPNAKGVPEKIKKRIIVDLDRAYFPDKIIVPFGEVIHDRITLELFRGCIRGCRFCQAGVIYRPVRERSRENLLDIAGKLIRNTGYEEISLLSLSTSDYSDLPEFTSALIEMTEKQMINMALPSLRIDNFSIELMQKIQKVRKSGLTFAPEAGTQRMRDIINKGITEEDILKSAKIAFEGGYQSIKLYFMIGLPYETDADIAGIMELSKKVVDVYFSIPREKAGRGVNITASVSSFVPKPFTPFQWVKQNSFDELMEKQKILRENIRSKKITLNYHESKLSVLEGVFARGDRRLGRVLEKASEAGCMFDGWSEHFSYEKWEKAFEECGINPADYTRAREYDETLPWDIIDVGVTKEFLINESEKAKRGETTKNCREGCSGCGASIWEGGVCFE